MQYQDSSKNTKSSSAFRPQQYSSSRHRRSIGATVNDMVENQLQLRAKSNYNHRKNLPTFANEISDYRPSFVSQHSNHKSDSNTKDLEDINDALEQRLHLQSSQKNRRNSGIHIKELGMEPKIKATSNKNALIEIGNPFQNSSHFPKPKVKPPTTFNKKTVPMGLSYTGPVLSSLENPNSNRRRSLHNTKMTTNTNFPMSQARPVTNARKMSLQTEDSTVIKQHTSGQQFPFPDQRNAVSATSPNTLTLDNWVAGEAGDEVGGNVGSAQSSRRNSSICGLAPLPDVDDFDDFNHGNAHIELKEVELEESDNNEQRKRSEFEVAGPSFLNRPTLNSLNTGKPFTLELASNLKNLLFGSSNKTFHGGWLRQSFTFRSDKKMRFGMIQLNGGPCGILASVQATVLKALLFGTKLDDTTKAVKPLEPTNSERNRALAVSLVTILERCSSNGTLAVVLPSNKSHFIGIGRYKSDGVTETMKIHDFKKVKECLRFIEQNIAFFTSEGTSAVIAFLYSVLISRGLSHICQDMDSPDLPFMGAHGYCSQEMVNLLLTGKAVSNTFDYNVSFEGSGSSTVLKGIDERSEIGLLSLFEHYKSCTVGDHLKTPKVPIWLICSESHFTVLFSLNLGEEKISRAERGAVRLYYYDGLSRQENIIELTVEIRIGLRLEGGHEEANEDLVPPLEHCIRTKWREANIDWNGSEKIL